MFLCTFSFPLDGWITYSDKTRKFVSYTKRMFLLDHIFCRETPGVGGSYMNDPCAIDVDQT